MEQISTLISTHLKNNEIDLKNQCWKIDKSPLGDRGLFATRDITVGELIFVDYPLVLGPRAALTSENNICISCYRLEDLKQCSKKCGLLVCSEFCENTETHKQDCARLLKWNSNATEADSAELTKCMTPVRALSLDQAKLDLIMSLKAHLDPKHGFEVDILKDKLQLEISSDDDKRLRNICAVLDANAFEVIIGSNDENNTTLRGLYPLAALANHNCVPNTIHVFDNKHFMVTRATVNIKAGEEIFHSYNRLIWGTLTRRFHLFFSKHFACFCKRCFDPTEFGTYMNAILCRKCYANGVTGYVVPIQPLKVRTKWCCNKCADVQDAEQVTFVMSVLGGRLKSLKEVDDILDFLQNKIKGSLPEQCNQIAVELKYQLVWMIGYKKGYLWEDLSNELIATKEQICREILHLLKLLGAGECKMKGLLLYELLCCHREKLRRRKQDFLSEDECVKIEHDLKVLLEISSEILSYDIGAPAEIKKLWKYESITDMLKQL